MNNRPLQLGDVCLIVGFRRFDYNLGKTCTLVRFMNTGDSFTRNGEMIRNDGEPAWFVEGASLEISMNWTRTVAGFSLEVERHLMPIRGDEAPAAIQEQQINEEQAA